MKVYFHNLFLKVPCEVFLNQTKSWIHLECIRLSNKHVERICKKKKCSCMISGVTLGCICWCTVMFLCMLSPQTLYQLKTVKLVAGIFSVLSVCLCMCMIETKRGPAPRERSLKDNSVNLTR